MMTRIPKSFTVGGQDIDVTMIERFVNTFSGFLTEAIRSFKYE